MPVSALEPSLWLVLARALDDSLARELRDLMGAEVAILSRDDRGRTVVLAASLAPAARAALAESENAGDPSNGATGPSERPAIRTLARIDYLAVKAALAGPSAAPLSAVLLRPTAAALLDFRQLAGGNLRSCRTVHHKSRHNRDETVFGAV